MGMRATQSICVCGLIRVSGTVSSSCLWRDARRNKSMYAFRAMAKRWLFTVRWRMRSECHPRSHKRVRGDLIRHRHIAG
jgi:hypothetical protein